MPKTEVSPGTCCADMVKWAEQCAVGCQGRKTDDRRQNVQFRFCPYCGREIVFESWWRATLRRTN